MFNKYHIDNTTVKEVGKKVNVHEYRAPTDDSVRLLNEIQDKARDNLVKSVVIDDNTLKGKLLIFKDLLSQGYNIIAEFTLNDEEYTIKKSITNLELHRNDTNLLNLIYDNLAKAIASALISNIDEQGLSLREIINNG